MFFAWIFKFIGFAAVFYKNKTHKYKTQTAILGLHKGVPILICIDLL
jgi:hypothetical protein